VERHAPLSRDTVGVHSVSDLQHFGSWSGHARRCTWKSSELSARTICTFSRQLSARRRTTPVALEELSWVSEWPMIIRMTTRSRPQRRYDHRLRDLVQRTGDLTIATDLGVPRSTARGWARRGAKGRGQSGGGGPHGAGTPAGDPEAAATRREARGAAPVGFGPVTHLRVQPLKRAIAGGRSQAADPTRHGSGASVSRCERSSGSCVCRRVGFTPGADGRPRARSTISRPVLARHRIDCGPPRSRRSGP
jgi:hypothetical protein